MEKNICILGAGNVGLTLGAYLADKKNNIRIYKKEKLEKDKVDFEYNLEGAVNLKSKISLMTNSLEKALYGAEIIFVALPAFCRKDYLKDVVNIIDAPVYIIFFPDNYGVLELDNLLKGSSKKNLFKSAGTNSFVYPCRKKSENYSVVKGIKKEIFVSSINKDYLEDILIILNKLWNIFSIRDNYLEIQLSNMNPIIHPIVLFLNLGRIENEGGNFDFYKEGISPTIAELIDKIDKERINVGKAVGINLSPLSKVMEEVYNSKEKNLYKSLTESKVHIDGLAPSSLDTRYIKEDIPYGLVPISILGKIKGVKTPLIDNIINIANIVMDENYYEKLDFREYLEKI